MSIFAPRGQVRRREGGRFIATSTDGRAAAQREYGVFAFR
jgi:hypothetical protein